MDDRIRFAASLGLKPSEFYGLTAREFELYAEGFQRRQDGERKFLAHLFAQSITPHVKGRTRGDQLYKGLPPEKRLDPRDRTEREMVLMAEIRATESAISMARGNVKPEQMEKRFEKLERLEVELRQLRQQRDMEEGWLNSEMHQRSEAIDKIK
jgi:hypothetical protein